VGQEPQLALLLARIHLLAFVSAALFIPAPDARLPDGCVYDRDINEKLRKSVFKFAAASKTGSKTHHTVFYYNYGKHGFDAVEFGKVVPFTDEVFEKMRGQNFKKKGERSGPDRWSWYAIASV
jgi:hypothetical protein